MQNRSGKKEHSHNEGPRQKVEGLLDLNMSSINSRRDRNKVSMKKIYEDLDKLTYPEDVDVESDPGLTCDPKFIEKTTKIWEKLQQLPTYCVFWWEHRNSGTWHTGNILLLDTEDSLALYEEALSTLPDDAVALKMGTCRVAKKNNERRKSSKPGLLTSVLLANGKEINLRLMCIETVIKKLDTIRMQSDPGFLPLAHNLTSSPQLSADSPSAQADSPELVPLAPLTAPFEWRSLTAPYDPEARADRLAMQEQISMTAGGRLLSLFGEISGCKDALILKPDVKSVSSDDTNIQFNVETKAAEFTSPLLKEYISLISAPTRTFIDAGSLNKADQQPTPPTPNDVTTQECPAPKRRRSPPSMSLVPHHHKDVQESLPSKMERTFNPEHQNFCPPVPFFKHTVIKHPHPVLEGTLLPDVPKNNIFNRHQPGGSHGLPSFKLNTRVFGVSFDRSKRNWEASWADARTGKRVKKCFSEGRWGIHAREKAVAARREAEMLGHVSSGLRQNPVNECHRNLLLK